MAEQANEDNEKIRALRGPSEAGARMATSERAVLKDFDESLSPARSDNAMAKKNENERISNSYLLPKDKANTDITLLYNMQGIREQREEIICCCLICCPLSSVHNLTSCLTAITGCCLLLSAIQFSLFCALLAVVTGVSDRFISNSSYRVLKEDLLDMPHLCVIAALILAPLNVIFKIIGVGSRQSLQTARIGLCRAGIRFLALCHGTLLLLCASLAAADASIYFATVLSNLLVDSAAVSNTNGIMDVAFLSEFNVKNKVVALHVLTPALLVFNSCTQEGKRMSICALALLLAAIQVWQSMIGAAPASFSAAAGLKMNKFANWLFIIMRAAVASAFSRIFIACNHNLNRTNR